MFYCYPGHLAVIFRSKHYLVSLLKNPKIALKKVKRATSARRRRPLTSNDAFDTFPKEFLRQTYPNTKMSRQLYIINEETAIKIGEHLSSSGPNKTIVENNPGLGFLTKALLNNGMNDLRLFEGRKEFITDLKMARTRYLMIRAPNKFKLSTTVSYRAFPKNEMLELLASTITDLIFADVDYEDVYPDRVQLINGDLLGLHKLAYVDNLDAGTRVNKLLSNLPTTEWQNDINFRLFGATGSTTFFKYLINSIVHQNSIMALGRCELFMVVPSTTYYALMCSKQAGYVWYRSYTIVFQIFFEYELLDKFPRTDFLPHIENKTAQVQGAKLPPVDRESMYFVKIVPRRNLYELCPAKEIKELWHFIKRNCFSRNNRIIPTLEKFIPGCGPQLLLKFNTANSVRSQPIEVNHLCELPSQTNPPFTLSKQDYYDNLNIYTQFGDLQPVHMLTLFYEFRNLADYSESCFLPSLDIDLLKDGPPSDGIETANIKTSNDTNDTNEIDNVKEDKKVEDK